MRIGAWLCLLVSGLCITDGKSMAGEAWELVRAEAEQANQPGLRPVGVFVGPAQSLHLSPNGQYTLQFQSWCGMSGPSSIEIGSFQRVADRLLLHPPTGRAVYQYDPVSAIDGYVYQPIAMPAANGEEQQVRQFLLVPQSDRLLLLEQDNLVEVANHLNSSGELPEWMFFTRDDERAPSHLGAQLVKLSVQDRARLPADLQRLLRDAGVSAKVTQLLNEPTLQWKDHQAVLRVQLDRGERDGVYVGMRLTTSGPDRMQGQLVEVGANRSVMELTVERFHPDDSPRMPAISQLFSTPTQSEGCSGVPGFAASGRILSIEPADAADLVWDDDGYAFAEAKVSVGAGSGLAEDDALTSEMMDFQVEYRVRGLQSAQSTVLVRIHRFGNTLPPEFGYPKVGDEVGTFAWAHARADSFAEEVDAVEPE